MAQIALQLECAVVEPFSRTIDLLSRGEGYTFEKRLYRAIMWVLVFGFTGNVFAQLPDTSYREVYHLPGPFHSLEVDPLGNAYVLNEAGDLLQVLPNGQRTFNYHNTVLGEPGHLDASDPFNLLLFYPEQQTLVLLDRTLSERSALDLRATEVQNVSAVARGPDNQLWVYDDYAGRLYKLNERGDILLASDDLRLAENLTIGADRMLRWEDRLLLHFPERGIAAFTFYGRLAEWWPIEAVNDWQLNGVSLLLRQDSVYRHYRPKTGSWQTFSPSSTEIISMRLLPGYYYYLRADGSLVVRQK